MNTKRIDKMLLIAVLSFFSLTSAQVDPNQTMEATMEPHMHVHMHMHSNMTMTSTDASSVSMDAMNMSTSMSPSMNMTSKNMSSNATEKSVFIGNPSSSPTVQVDMTTESTEKPKEANFMTTESTGSSWIDKDDAGNHKYDIPQGDEPHRTDDKSSSSAVMGSAPTMGTAKEMSREPKSDTSKGGNGGEWMTASPLTLTASILLALLSQRH